MRPGGPTPGHWYVLSCGGQDFIPSTGVFWIPSAAAAPAGPGPVDPLTLAEKAADSIVLPSPSIYTNPSKSTVVNFLTWLWVNSVIWHPFEASASAGAVTATAIATPSSVTWSTGDGSTEFCPGPGVPYDPNETPGEQSTYCSHTYSQSSAGQPSANGNPNDGAYPVTATVRWAVTWTVTGASGGGTLPSLQTQSTAPLRVEQVESVETSD
ncbi:MAG: hypothetical protein ACRD6W_12665 [Nitrososphaerales archaeon]